MEEVVRMAWSDVGGTVAVSDTCQYTLSAIVPVRFWLHCNNALTCNLFGK